MSGSSSDSSSDSPGCSGSCDFDLDNLKLVGSCSRFLVVIYPSLYPGVFGSVNDPGINADIDSGSLSVSL